MKYALLLREFLKQANTKNLKTSKYSQLQEGIRSKASFGQGAQALVPWVSFTTGENTTANGIYPVYLFYKSKGLLILAYGVSVTRSPEVMWNLVDPETVATYFQRNGYGNPERYGSSFVFKVYREKALPSDEELDRDLQQILHEYRSTLKNLNGQRANSQDRSTRFDLSPFLAVLEDVKLVFPEQLVKRYVASLLTKPFVILTGLSGSGKTQLAKAFASWLSQSNEQYCVVAVGSDWTNRDPLLGYPNGLKVGEYMLPETGILQLILRANAHPELPYFLILDEMNLSHVERYFADFLSTMESGEPILLHDREINDVPRKVTLPKNLFITGTVNIDETTYMFSPKVLDRANVIEFRIHANDMESFLRSPARPNSLKHSNKVWGTNFIELAQKEMPAQIQSELTRVLMNFFLELQRVGAEFGYRTAAEIFRLFRYLEEFNITDGDEKLDIAIMQKLLPKLHGSRRKLVPVLEALARCCTDSSQHDHIREYLQNGIADENAIQPLTINKLQRLYRSALDNGFASYAEA